MRELTLLIVYFIFILIPIESIAAVVNISLAEDDNVRIMDFYVDESGAIYRGQNKQVRIDTRKGYKLLKLVITARVVVYPYEYKQRQAYYDRFALINESIDRRNRLYRIYEIKDVVRLSFEFNKNTLEVNKKLGVDYSTPALALLGSNGNFENYDKLVKLQDNMDFGIVDRPFSGPSNSGATICLEQKQNPDYPMIVECVKWGKK